MAQVVVERSPKVFERSPKVLESIRRDLERLDVAPSLRLSIKEHYENLLSLATNLQRLGLDHVVVDQEVLSVFNQYRQLLLQHLSTLPVRAPNGTDDDHD